MLPQQLNKGMDDTAADVAKALFLAGKINCDCEVCKLLVAAGAKMVTQLGITAPPPGDTSAVTPGPATAGHLTGE
jgi:hypothetical protein